MAHFAQLDDNNTVLQVIVVHNNELLVNGEESEQKGIDFCKSLFGANTIWKQTSYNATYRKNYAGQGFTYDEDRDAFIAPKPYESWTLDETTCKWAPPTPYPNDGQLYSWDEDIKAWTSPTS